MDASGKCYLPPLSQMHSPRHRHVRHNIASARPEN
ncbi:hypothetical protein SMJ63A_50038 [Stenotrophomonas geniculata]